MMAMMAYSCTSTSLLLVNGGRTSSIGAGVLRPFSPSCEHSVRRIKNRVARSERGSAGGRRAFEREVGVSGLKRESFDPKGGRDDMFEVGVDLGRGCSWSRDMLMLAPICKAAGEAGLQDVVEVRPWFWCLGCLFRSCSRGQAEPPMHWLVC